ncbi:hypothetical protein BJV77DRAFT_568 [Russula vinacea]|nr:hypothetical protein BJV77DRAFT_568 [Russula vinacea]
MCHSKRVLALFLNPAAVKATHKIARMHVSVIVYKPYHQPNSSRQCYDRMIESRNPPPQDEVSPIVMPLEKATMPTCDRITAMQLLQCRCDKRLHACFDREMLEMSTLTSTIGRARQPRRAYKA